MHIPGRLTALLFLIFLTATFEPALSQGTRYDKTGKFVNGYAVVIKDGKYGLIEEKTNREVVAPKYDHLRNFRHGRAAFRWGKIKGYIYPDGHEAPKGCGC